MAADGDGIRAAGDLTPALPQGVKDGLQQLWRGAAQRERPAAGGAGAEECRRLDAVGQDGIGRAGQRLAAGYADTGRSRR